MDDVIPAYHPGSCVSAASQVVPSDDVIPAYHAGSCVSSGHFGRRNPSEACWKLFLKLSFWTTSSQHTMRRDTFRVLTFDGVIPAYHAESYFSGGPFGRRNPSIPCRELRFKWSLWLTGCPAGSGEHVFAHSSTFFQKFLGKPSPELLGKTSPELFWLPKVRK